MNRLICAVFFFAMAAGTASAADNALSDLKAAVPPSALETAVEPPPAPAPIPEVVTTPLTAETIKGEYLVKTAGMPVLRIIFADDATLIKPDPAGDLVCKGTYTLDTAKMFLITDFKDCGGSSLTHTMYLQGQTVESLTAGVKVLSSILLDGDVTPQIPVKIQKTK